MSKPVLTVALDTAKASRVGAVLRMLGTTVREARLVDGGGPADSERFIEHYLTLLPQVDLVLISGSLSPGIPKDFYRRLTGLAFQRVQVRTVIDSGSADLAEAIRATPYFLKLNRAELEVQSGRPLSSMSAVLKAARELIEAGPLVVGVSLGAQGLLLVSPQASWWAVPPQVEAVTFEGAGDALVAGFVHGLLQGLDPTEILRLAVGCGTACVSKRSVAHVQSADVQATLERVRVERVG